jgi:hypothetical protein
VRAATEFTNGQRSRSGTQPASLLGVSSAKEPGDQPCGERITGTGAFDDVDVEQREHRGTTVPHDGIAGLASTQDDQVESVVEQFPPGADGVVAGADADAGEQLGLVGIGAQHSSSQQGIAVRSLARSAVQHDPAPTALCVAGGGQQRLVRRLQLQHHHAGGGQHPHDDDIDRMHDGPSRDEDPQTSTVTAQDQPSGP